MKHCTYCGAQLPDAAEFCSECGTKQVAVTQQPGQQTQSQQAPTQPQPQKQWQSQATAAQASSQTLQSLAAYVNRADRLGYIGAGIVALSVFMPLVTVVKLISINIMDLSKGLMLAIFAIAAISAYAVNKQKHAISAALGTGLLVFILAAVFKYNEGISAMQQSLLGQGLGALAREGGGFMKNLVGEAITLDWGLYLFAFGALLLVVAGMVYTLKSSERVVNLGNCLVAWKELLFAQVKIETHNVPAWAITIVELAVLGFIVYQANPLKDLHF